jgi:hypothetical protein
MKKIILLYIIISQAIFCGNNLSSGASSSSGPAKKNPVEWAFARDFYPNYTLCNFIQQNPPSGETNFYFFSTNDSYKNSTLRKRLEEIYTIKSNHEPVPQYGDIEEYPAIKVSLDDRARRCTVILASLNASAYLINLSTKKFLHYDHTSEQASFPLQQEDNYYIALIPRFITNEKKDEFEKKIKTIESEDFNRSTEFLDPAPARMSIESNQTHGQYGTQQQSLIEKNAIKMSPYVTYKGLALIKLLAGSYNTIEIIPNPQFAQSRIDSTPNDLLPPISSEEPTSPVAQSRWWNSKKTLPVIATGAVAGGFFLWKYWDKVKAWFNG